MGIETPADLSGSECSFTSAIIAVEELAKVDASVAVMVDVHNTLVNTVVRLYGSDAIKEKWLPGLATNKVSWPSTTLGQASLHTGRIVLSFRERSR
jgi:short/branched chain acyl-CoA dehydrogenase